MKSIKKSKPLYMNKIIIIIYTKNYHGIKNLAIFNGQEFGLYTNFLILEADKNDTTSEINYILECSVLLD